MRRTNLLWLSEIGGWHASCMAHALRRHGDCICMHRASAKWCLINRLRRGADWCSWCKCPHSRQPHHNHHGTALACVCFSDTKHIPCHAQRKVSCQTQNGRGADKADCFTPKWCILSGMRGGAWNTPVSAHSPLSDWRTRG